MYVHTCLGFERFLNAFMFTIMHPELLENRWKCVTIQVGWDVKRITIQLVVGGSSYECISEGNWHQRLSYYREMRGSVSFTIGESITANLDHVCLNNQSHYSLDVIEFQSELYGTQSSFTDPIVMKEFRKMNPTCRNKSVTSLIKKHFFVVNSKNSSIQKYCLV